MAAGLEHARFSKRDLGRVACELRISAAKTDSRQLAHRAAAAVAADEPLSSKLATACEDSYAGFGLLEIFNAITSQYLDAQLVRARRENRFDTCHVCGDIADRPRQTVLPLGAVNLVVEELDAGEVTCGTARLLQPVRGGRRRSFMARSHRCPHFNPGSDCN